MRCFCTIFICITWLLNLNAQQKDFTVTYFGYNISEIYNEEKLLNVFNNSKLDGFSIFHGGSFGSINIEDNLFREGFFSFSNGVVSNESYISSSLGLKKNSFTKISLGTAYGINLTKGRLILSPNIGFHLIGYFTTKWGYVNSFSKIDGFIKTTNYSFEKILSSEEKSHGNISTRLSINILLGNKHHSGANFFLRPYVDLPVFKYNFQRAISYSNDEQLKIRTIFYGLELGVGFCH